MQPSDYVRGRIREGKAEEIIGLIHRFRDEMNAPRPPGVSRVRNFAEAFLIAVAGQLRQLDPGRDLHDDPLLTVWAELGYLGIERDWLPDDPEDRQAT